MGHEDCSCVFQSQVGVVMTSLVPLPLVQVKEMAVWKRSAIDSGKITEEMGCRIAVLMEEGCRRGIRWGAGCCEGRGVEVHERW